MAAVAQAATMISLKILQILMAGIEIGFLKLINDKQQSGAGNQI
jgi:hypothetical protein